MVLGHRNGLSWIGRGRGGMTMNGRDENPGGNRGVYKVRLAGDHLDGWGWDGPSRGSLQYGDLAALPGQDPGHRTEARGEAVQGA
jgi:hypothetical protein